MVSANGTTGDGCNHKSNESGKRTEPPPKKIKLGHAVVKKEPVDICAQEKEERLSLIGKEGQPKDVSDLNKSIKIETDDESQPKKADLACSTERVCSVCKVSKSLMDSFFQKQRKKGSSAICKDCTNAANNARVQAQKRAKEARKFEQQAEDKMMEDLKERACAICNDIKRKDDFHKIQQKMGKRSRCKDCVNEVHTKAVEAYKTKAAKKQKIQESVGVNDLKSSSGAKGEEVQLPRPGEPSSQNTKLSTHVSSLEGTNADVGQNAATGMVPTSLLSRKDTETQNKAPTLTNSDIPVKTEELKAAHGTPIKHLKGIKKKTTITEMELDDGTQIVESEKVEIHPDGTIVTRVNRESTLEQTIALPDGSQSIEKTVTKSTTEKRVVFPSPQKK
mmetsp:Transcript_32532/g.68401  ORF Transcript_32532/g.68401 Transcript_32532/m.68401 type:complete len:391 (-) Transcript_32532:139-1311(-)|eukprot:CAMPEP_0172315534 /NCGR_PEP_ID=MMETSP1058-20130122/25475_1 /TAXON_ID=83371 /ORGANISM="Detonula confervacea, Strain CCMP 353" /LENGTH=390 /DNA_ID=CAMNT_0013029621 /DNA_START=190 /DNA_END=1362 /DNA_ORIENTATION=+